MKSVRYAVPAAIALLAFAACDDPTDIPFDEAAVTQDIAASAGDAAVMMIETLMDNETAVGGGAELGAGSASGPASTVVVSRSTTCFDAAGAPVTNCLPFSSVRKIAVATTLSGSRSSTRTNATTGATVTWAGTLDRTSNDTITRVFNGSTEASRVHSGNAVVHDVTTFTEGDFSRSVTEAARDSVKNITFNLPRSSNPYPASGSIARTDTVKVQVSKGGRSISRDGVHRVEVIFPADLQGNVILKINAKTCKLNLVTRAVTNCQ